MGAFGKAMKYLVDTKVDQAIIKFVDSGKPFVGICLGILQSWLIFLEISKELEGAKFSVPIGEVGILIGITIIASILASVIPANEASKTYPAEALRYE